MRIHPGLSFVLSWCGLRVLPTCEVRDAPAAVGLLCQREGPGEFGREAHMCRVAVLVLAPGNPAANIDTRNASVFGIRGRGGAMSGFWSSLQLCGKRGRRLPSTRGTNLAGRSWLMHERIP